MHWVEHIGVCLDSDVDHVLLGGVPRKHDFEDSWNAILSNDVVVKIDTLGVPGLHDTEV